MEWVFLVGVWLGVVRKKKVMGPVCFPSSPPKYFLPKNGKKLRKTLMVWSRLKYHVNYLSVLCHFFFCGYQKKKKNCPLVLCFFSFILFFFFLFLCFLCLFRTSHYYYFYFLVPIFFWLVLLLKKFEVFIP